ncbi:MAG TPA: Ig-like domain-containing protein [Vicinamibacterales bacterium]|nr:Ig-like domain-containing protein [Vicinamibacterales bacterium]
MAASSHGCTFGRARGGVPGACLALLLPLAAAAAAPQVPTRVATTVETLLAAAGFFHGRHIVLRQRLVEERGLVRIADASKPIYVFSKDRPAAGDGEVRGEFWDLGRTEQGDPRFTAYDFTYLLEATTGGRWPRRDEVYVLLGASVTPALPPGAPTIRAIALAPDDYVDREVKVIGRFKGRNLYGELPLAIGKSKWDFVIQSADGAVWVTGVRPRGKGFDFDPGKRVDTGQWVEVTGVVRREGTTTYIDARTIALAAAPEETAVEVELPPLPREPPPVVTFSAPVADDTDVERGAPVRIQFSRDLDPRTVRAPHVRVSYVDPAAAPKPPAFTVVYNDAARAIEIRFPEPLERFQQVKVELLDGITAIDGQPLEPWSLTFTTGAKEAPTPEG